MNLSLFELYLKYMTMMYFILFEFMIKYLFLNNFVNTCGYPWISADMKKIDGYPTDMDTGIWQIFIQRIGYERATTRTLPVPLTSQVSSCE